MYQLLADAALITHLAFIAFVLGGGLLTLRWPRLAWLHLPAAIWGVCIEMMGWICPLTHLENHFLQLAGANGYQEDFIAHYLLPIIYPAGLTTTIQAVLGGIVIVVNAVIYTVVVIKAKQRRSSL